MQDSIEFANGLMDQKIRTFADRQAKNKRKLDDNSRNNQTQQQPHKSLSFSIAEVPSASALQVLRRLGSIFTSVYAVVQKLKKDSWLELQFSLADNSKLNVVRILQKSQENGQNRTNTDTRKEREYKSRENAIKVKSKGKCKLDTWLSNSSTKGHAGRVTHHQTLPLVETHKENATRMKKTHQGLVFCTKRLEKEAQWL
ncbi:hypothetical protein Tco_0725852 [Tanacetum coccineum]|uniref:Uncharacterized protein n=1 Tax=Tanacetum coccineum TaxID=301880 RepID=A0ABQ4YEZ4_9ASTR